MPYYSLPQLAADKGIKPKTLRAWAATGILKPSAMTAGGQARYSDVDFEAARLRSLGQKDVVSPLPITIRRGGDVAAWCKEMKQKLSGTTPKKRRRKRAA